MGMLPCLLLTSVLAAQGPVPIPELSVDLRTDLGREPNQRIQLTPAGCWDGLLLVAARPQPPNRKGAAGATVEVWDLLPPSSPRRDGFELYLGTLRERLSKAWLAPPPVHGAIELSEIMLSDPSNPQKLDLTKVKSLQERYNRLPPNGSPVK